MASGGLRTVHEREQLRRFGLRQVCLSSARSTSAAFRLAQELSVNLDLVLVLFDLGADVLICRITSVFYSGRLDVELRDWSLAGLEKPSVARLNRLVTAEKSLLTKYLGRLASSDAITRRHLTSCWAK